MTTEPAVVRGHYMRCLRAFLQKFHNGSTEKQQLERDATVVTYERNATRTHEFPTWRFVQSCRWQCPDAGELSALYSVITKATNAHRLRLTVRRVNLLEFLIDSCDSSESLVVVALGSGEYDPTCSPRCTLVSSLEIQWERTSP